MKRTFFAVAMVSLLFCAVAMPLQAEGSLINNEGSWYSVELDAEQGFVTVLSHTIQFGQSGTKFDYKEDGNQDVLFPFQRFTASVRLFDTHQVVFLYQPLDIITQAVVGADTRFYDTVFPAGTVMDIRYGFSFYRASYLWYFLKDKKNELGVGLSLQVRNASIIISAADGTQIVVNENVGPVPIIKIAGAYHFDNGVWTALDADGFYASGQGFNGAGYPFIGAIWDVSARLGVELKNGISPYLNLRCLGGGAKGTSSGEDAQGDGYTENWLNTVSVTLGVRFN